jgi:hypothetical protein
MSEQEIRALLAGRLSLLESIAQASDEISRIDKEIALLRRQDLEADLIQAEKRATGAMIEP